MNKKLNTHSRGLKRRYFWPFVLVGLFVLVAAIWLKTSTSSLAMEDMSNQVLRISNGSEPSTLDPQRIRNVPELNIARNLFEGLVQQTDDGNIEPAQAESWTVSDSRLVYTFYLRPNNRWSNGEPVTAHDFVYAWRRGVDPNLALPYAWYFEAMGVENASAIVQGESEPETLGVVALDDFTFEVTLERLVPFFLAKLAHVTTMPVHSRTVEEFHDTWTLPENMVSNGAYQLDDWVVNERITMSKNQYHWDFENIQIERAAFFPLEAHVAYQRYRSGEIDMMISDVPSQVARSLTAEQEQELVVSPQLGTYYYTFNLEHPALQDRRVRQALSYVIDRDLLVERLLSGYEWPRLHWVPEGILEYQSPDLVGLGDSHLTQEERIERAQELMREAGFGEENPLTLNLLYNTSDPIRRLSLAIGSMWNEHLGVELNLRHQEWRVFLDTRAQGNFDILSSSWVVDVNHPSGMLEVMRSNHPNNLGYYYNEEYDALLDEAQEALAPSDRLEYYQQAELMVLEDRSVLPLYQYVNLSLIKPYVLGYPADNPQVIYYIKNLSFDF